MNHLINTPNIAIPSDLSRQVFLSAIRFVSHVGRHHLDVDVAITPVLNADILEILADMLWRHRQLAASTN